METASTIIIGLIVGIAIYLGFCALMWWRVFEKAGQPGWGSIVPIYNTYLLVMVAKRPVSFFIALIAMSFVGNFFDEVPMIALILALGQFVLYVIIASDISRLFGKGTGFTVGLVLLPFIFYPILGFGGAEYEAREQGGMRLEE